MTTRCLKCGKRLYSKTLKCRGCSKRGTPNLVGAEKRPCMVPVGTIYKVTTKVVNEVD